MAENSVEEKAITKAEQWRERIAEQVRLGLSVKQFCGERGLAECSFYAWRKRLGENKSVRFALVERGAARPGAGAESHLEVVFPSGERLRIGSGVDATTLRTVLDALRA